MLANLRITAFLLYVWAYAVTRASEASFEAPYMEIGSNGEQFSGVGIIFDQ